MKSVQPLRMSELHIHHEFAFPSYHRDATVFHSVEAMEHTSSQEYAGPGCLQAAFAVDWSSSDDSLWTLNESIESQGAPFSLLELQTDLQMESSFEMSIANTSSQGLLDTYDLDLVTNFHLTCKCCFESNLDESPIKPTNESRLDTTETNLDKFDEKFLQTPDENKPSVIVQRLHFPFIGTTESTDFGANHCFEMSIAPRQHSYDIDNRPVQGSRRLAPASRSVLNDYFERNIRCPYPTQAEKRDLAERAGISMRMLSE